LIGGPCSVESEEQISSAAELLVSLSVYLFLGEDVTSLEQVHILFRDLVFKA